MTDVRLARNVAFPLDLATQTSIVFGKRGSGKSNTAVVAAEQLHRAGVPFISIDPVDDWWGVKAPAKRAGLEVCIFGGRHADLPLEAGSGALLADVAVDARISMVLSVKHLEGPDRSRFVTDFARQLLKRNREPVHVFLEEAHELAPENPMKAERQHVMLGAINRLWKLGRSSGIGGSAITQRPASLSKNITTQAEILIVHRLIGPQDVEAVRQWIKYHGQHQEILGELAGLKTGEAFVWAPDFPEDAPLELVRAKINQRTTFDSSATPKAGKRRSEPPASAFAKIDLEQLRDQLAATIERAEANDPDHLRRELQAAQRRIADLEATPAAAEPALDPDVLEAAQVAGAAAQREADEARIHGVLDQLSGIRQRLEALEGDARGVVTRAEDLRGRLDEATEALAVDLVTAPPVRAPRPKAAPLKTPAAAPRPASPPAVAPGGSREDRILGAVRALTLALEGRPAPRQLVAALSGSGHWVSTFQRACGRLKTAGLVDYPDPGSMALTGPGLERATSPAEDLNVAAVQAAVLATLKPARAKVLRVLLDHHDGLDRDELARLAGTNAGVSTFQRACGWLKNTGRFIEYPRDGFVRALPFLYLESY